MSSERERASKFKIGQKVKGCVGGGREQRNLPREGVEGVISGIKECWDATEFTIRTEFGEDFKPFYANQLTNISDEFKKIYAINSGMIDDHGNELYSLHESPIPLDGSYTLYDLIKHYPEDKE